MNYAIQSETQTFSYLEVTPRKRATKHSLIRVENGLALFKLGKQEYAIEAGQAIWVPIECLCSLSFFPNTSITRVDFSVRLRDRFPHQSGLVSLSDLATALLNRLKESQSDEDVYPHLLQVLKDEVKALKPELKTSTLSRKLDNWKPNQNEGIDKEQHVVLLIREAMKRRLSGVKSQLIIDELFSGNENQFEQLTQLVLGDKL